MCSCGAQDVKGRGDKGSKSWHRLARAIPFCFVLSSSFNRFFFIVSFYSNPQFPSGKEWVLWEFGGVSMSSLDLSQMVLCFRTPTHCSPAAVTRILLTL